MRLRYAGPCDGVIVPLPDGAEVEVRSGGEHDFDDPLARRLLDQPANWERADRADRRPKAQAAADGEE